MVYPPYSVCLRLIATVGSYYEAFDGEKASKGQDPFDLNPRRFFNMLYFWCITHVETDKVEEFERKLNEPIAGSKGKVSDLEKQKDADSFMAFAGAMGISPPKPS